MMEFCKTLRNCVSHGRLRFQMLSQNQYFTSVRCHPVPQVLSDDLNQRENSHLDNSNSQLIWLIDYVPSRNGNANANTNLADQQNVRFIAAKLVDLRYYLHLFLVSILGFPPIDIFNNPKNFEIPDYERVEPEL